jgi:hypothetical protein
MRDGTGAFDANGRLIDTGIASTVTLVPVDRLPRHGQHSW